MSSRRRASRTWRFARRIASTTKRGARSSARDSRPEGGGHPHSRLRQVALVPLESGALPLRLARPDAERKQLVRRAKLLAGLGLAWHAVEAVVAVGAGVMAGSVALIGFGARLRGRVRGRCRSALALRRRAPFLRSRRAEGVSPDRSELLLDRSLCRLRGGSAAHRRRTSGGELDRDRARGRHAGDDAAARERRRAESPSGLARPRPGPRGARTCSARICRRRCWSGWAPTRSSGWWWADPVTALLIAAVAVREGREAWAGETCCDAC